MITEAKIIAETIEKSHSTILSLPKKYGANFIVNEINLPDNSEKLLIHPRIHDNQKNKIINSEDIIEIKEKARGKNLKQQFYFIIDAHLMNETAQNKFLKLLEEPRKNLHFILVTDNLQKMLLTIKSRAQIVNVSPVTKNESLTVIGKYKIADEKKSKILYLAEGLPGEITKLSEDKKHYTESSEAMQYAKIWLSGTRFEKICAANELKQNRERALLSIEQTLDIARRTFSEKTAHLLINKIDRLTKAHKQLSSNANIRLTLLELAV